MKVNIVATVSEQSRKYNVSHDFFCNTVCYFTLVTNN